VIVTLSPRRLQTLVRVAAFAAGTALAIAVASPAAAIDTPPVAAGEQAGATGPATSAADKWLKLLDAGRFDESWSDAADVFREGVTRDEWVAQLGAIRTRVGRTLIRELKTADFSSSVRGAPSGEYVTVIFLTQFEKAPPALETVITTRAADGNWHIAGYNIGAAPPPDPPR